MGLCTVTCTGIVGFLALAPLGNFLGSYLANIFVFLGGTIGPITIGLLAACLLSVPRSCSTICARAVPAWAWPCG